jgi:hypothetical protein
MVCSLLFPLPLLLADEEVDVETVVVIEEVVVAVGVVDFFSWKIFKGI